MSVSFEAFEKWVSERFQGDYVPRGNEICINSIFTDDSKHHLWCNPKGGKHNRKDGCYRCFKSDKIGTLVGLVMMVDQCTYEEAKDILNGQTSISVLEEELDAFFANKENIVIAKPKVTGIKLPDEALLISNMPEESIYRMNAESYLTSRKLPFDNFYYCAIGKYSNRIIIPYYNHEGSLVYFNGRHIDPKAKLRYRGPEKEIGVGKGDVLYSPKWAPEGDKIYLTEGEFDALSLELCGFYGVACGGKFLSDLQLDIIKKHNYKVCIASDNDATTNKAAAPGFVGMLEMSKKLLSKFIPVTYVKPPNGFKDWNAMLLKYKPEIIKEFIIKKEIKVDPFTLEQLICAI